ncbi:hypothetical protein S40293_00096 [Stachybotrys chartarum IBT 40293]|nr:hypothetical protein S40293_00096 [Stachybotrys chartarum IBT 40293]
MPSITLSDSRKLSYALDTEPKDAPIVILSNSLAAPFTIWDHVVAALNKAGFRTLRYDQPGHGESSAPKGLDTTFPSMADDVHALLQQLQITKLYAWIGVSMGASTGFYFVTKYPGIVGKFIICDTISCSPRHAGTEDVFGPRVQNARTKGNMEDTVDGTMERWFGKDFIQNHPEEAQRVRKIMLRTTVDGFETCCHALCSDTFDLRPLFGKVGAAVNEAICIVGENDANLPQAMEEMRQKIEESFKAAGKGNKVELKVIKNAGHVCFVDGLEQFLQVLLDVLKA